jgi:hypothetical protein
LQAAAAAEVAVAERLLLQDLYNIPAVVAVAPVDCY